MTLHLDKAGQRWSAHDHAGYDLSIPLRFDGSQPRFFSAPAAAMHAYRVDDFSGSVVNGASCNCSTHSLTPHCNGTHTECVGHITTDGATIRTIAPRGILLAALLTVEPKVAAHTVDALSSLARDDDAVIDTQLLRDSPLDALFAAVPLDALILRTLPNDSGKLSRDYDRQPAPYLTAAAIELLVAHRIEHLLIDLPSIDRAHDGGALAAHRAFWGLPGGGVSAKLAKRPHATITELCYIDDEIIDGQYLLSLQVAPFETDAAPSRPIIYPVLAP